MALLAVALLTSLHGAALAAAPIAAHARAVRPGVTRPGLARSAPRPVLAPDPRSPLASCLLRPCGALRLEPPRAAPRVPARPRPEQLVADLTRLFTQDPALTRAAMWLGSQRLRLDVRDHRWFLSLRLPTP